MLDPQVTMAFNYKFKKGLVLDNLGMSPFLENCKYAMPNHMPQIMRIGHIFHFQRGRNPDPRMQIVCIICIQFRYGNNKKGTVNSH